ncbi:chemotaxis protein CheD [Limisalsivibrio acetivorans]|uniref:chemotaxis protein CheD n=1 Tax=Limisalsivibrio acetivorans TaxID=1304888 RepID=UPI0003B3BA0D|nr:chemotaxis protein CheD [Limisalsivibrio acetivorans]
MTSSKGLDPKRPKIYIHAGQLHVTNEEVYISTVLGSCVAVCLFDNVKRVAGMNHYLLPLWNGEGLKSLKYGNVSIKKLIESMEKKGANRMVLVAKLFGGASPQKLTNEGLMIGEKNITVAKDHLAKEGIKVVASDLGGFKGRRILMDSRTGGIKLKYTSRDEAE